MTAELQRPADAPPPPTLLKRLEHAGKVSAGWLLGIAMARPWLRRMRDARLDAPRRVLLVRIDDRVGEALLTTPLIESVRRSLPDVELDLLVHRKALRVLSGLPGVHRLFVYDRRALVLGPFEKTIAEVRARDYDVVVNCGNWTAPSVSSAIIARLCGPRAAVLGPDVWPVRALHSRSVRAVPDTRSEVVQRVHLLSPVSSVAPVHQLTFRPPTVGSEVEAFLSRLGDRPHAVVNPGGRLDWRRVPPSAFARAARTLLDLQIVPVVTWGPGEESLASQVSALVPGSVLAPATTVDELAAVMRAARLTVCNNTGPMHLSVAVGTPTLALFLRMDIERWGHARSPHRMLDLTPFADDPAAIDGALDAALRALASAVGPGASPSGAA